VLGCGRNQTISSEKQSKHRGEDGSCQSAIPPEWQRGCEPGYTSGNVAGIPKTVWMYPLKTSQPRQTVDLGRDGTRAVLPPLTSCGMKDFAKGGEDQ